VAYQIAQLSTTSGDFEALFSYFKPRLISYVGKNNIQYMIRVCLYDFQNIEMQNLSTAKLHSAELMYIALYWTRHVTARYVKLCAPAPHIHFYIELL